jgi:multiple sugar transport system substrate-binding protein
MRAALLAVAACLTALALASCRGGSNNGRATLNLWVFQEPSGSFTDAASAAATRRAAATRSSSTLSNDADQQRQSLVRRLAAKDSSAVKG